MQEATSNLKCELNRMALQELFISHIVSYRRKDTDEPTGVYREVTFLKLVCMVRLGTRKGRSQAHMNNVSYNEERYLERSDRSYLPLVGTPTLASQGNAR